jgi:hypothetical protein
MKHREYAWGATKLFPDAIKNTQVFHVLLKVVSLQIINNSYKVSDSSLPKHSKYSCFFYLLQYLLHLLLNLQNFTSLPFTCNFIWGRILGTNEAHRMRGEQITIPIQKIIDKVVSEEKEQSWCSWFHHDISLYSS